ncbi:MAG: AEC family transporter [Actinomycetaceae bacterium]|nr:AEC family transporter [Actinomycetaceae bacterium]
MSEVFVSLWTLVVFMAIGVALVRARVFPATADRSLAKLAFYALIPALIFASVSRADPAAMVSRVAVVNVLPLFIVFGAYYVLAVHVFRLKDGEQTIGALSASYTNAGNIGAAYLLAVVGDVSPAAPIILVQLCVVTPLSFMALSRQTGQSGQGMWRDLFHAVSQPPVVSVVSGLVVALTGIQFPSFVMTPVDALADVAVPISMMAIGMSLSSVTLPRVNRAVLPLVTAVVFQVFLVPLVTFGLAMAFKLSGVDLLTVMTLSTIPTANNVFNYAHRYGVGVDLCRDTILLTVILSMPVLAVVVAIFHI